MKRKLLSDYCTNPTEVPDDDISIISISTFLDSLKGLGNDDSFKREYFFRGHANSEWKPIPSIYREGGWINNEDLMIKDLISRCPNDFKYHRYTFESLVKMQHYSLPTRLLDITTNPLVALFFSCFQEKIERKNDSEIEADGEVLVFSPFKSDIKYYDSDTVSVLSNIAKCPRTFNLSEAPRSTKETHVFNATQKIQLLLHEIKREKPHFEAKIRHGDIESVVFVRPLMDNQRIVKQDGAFILFGIDHAKTKPAKISHIFYPRNRKARLLIPADKKKKILDDLESLGISNSTVFPEIDNIAKFIRLQYQHAK